MRQIVIFAEQELDSDFDQNLGLDLYDRVQAQANTWLRLNREYSLVSVTTNLATTRKSADFALTMIVEKPDMKLKPSPDEVVSFESMLRSRYRID